MKYVHFNSNIIKISIFVLLSSITGSCTNEDINVVPDVIVNLKLDMTSELASLQGVGILATITPDSTKNSGIGWSIVDYHDKKLGKFSINQTTQNNGIILYHSMSSEYLAFDLTCPYNAFVPKPIGDCALTYTFQGDYLPICPCCGSKFNLEDFGFPSTGSKANHSLMPYKVSFSTDNLTMYVTK